MKGTLTMKPIPTVTVMTRNGPVRYNAADYRPEMGALVGDAATPAQDVQQAPPPVAPAPTPQPAQPAAPAPAAQPAAALQVVKRGRKFFVIDAAGETVRNTNGYSKEADAWGAILNA